MKGPPQGPRLHIDIPRVQLLIEDKEGIKQLGKHRTLPAARGPGPPCPQKGCGQRPVRPREASGVPGLSPSHPSAGQGTGASPRSCAPCVAALAASRRAAAPAGEQLGKSPTPACPGATVGLPAAGKLGDPMGVG